MNGEVSFQDFFRATDNPVVVVKGSQEVNLDDFFTSGRETFVKAAQNRMFVVRRYNVSVTDYEGNVEVNEDVSFKQAKAWVKEMHQEGYRNASIIEVETVVSEKSSFKNVERTMTFSEPHFPAADNLNRSIRIADTSDPDGFCIIRANHLGAEVIDKVSTPSSNPETTVAMMERKASTIKNHTRAEHERGKKVTRLNPIIAGQPIQVYQEGKLIWSATYPHPKAGMMELNTWINANRETASKPSTVFYLPTEYVNNLRKRGF